MDKRALKEEMVDLRLKLAEAENQANKIRGLLPTKWGLTCKFHWRIQQADNELCEIANEMDLDKMDLVEPRRIN